MSICDPKPMLPMTAAEIERFWSYGDVRGPNECWPWLRCKQPSGHGRFRVGGKYGRTLKAARIAYFLQTGKDPFPFDVCHTCDNPTCVNPAHLWKGTQTENTADRHVKGRDARGPKHGLVVHPQMRPRGEKSGTAKLTAAMIKKIRKLYATGMFRQRDVGALFGIGQAQTGRIIRRLSWAHVL